MPWSLGSAAFRYDFIRRRRIAAFNLPSRRRPASAAPEPGGARHYGRSRANWRPIRRRRRNRYPGPSRRPAVRAISSPGDRGARHYLDSRRPRSHAGRRAFRRTQGQRRLGIERRASRPCRELLPLRRGARRILFRLADRPPGPQETVHDHACRLSPGDRRHRLVMGCVEFRRVPFCHRRRHRRRVHCHQFDNPGAYPGAVPRLDRPCHQRQFLGRRGRWGGRFAGFARSRRHRPGARLAACFPDRGHNRTYDSR